MKDINKAKRIFVSIDTIVNNYDQLYHTVYNLVYDKYSRKNLPITIKFDENTYVTMRISSFIINLVFMRPYVQFNVPITPDILFDTTNISESTLHEKFDSIINTFFTHPNVKSVKELSVCLAHMVELLVKISRDFQYQIANTLSLFDIMETAERNPRFNEIIRTKFDDNASIKYVEEQIDKLSKEIIQIIYNDPKSELRPFLKAGGNINTIQLSQVLVSIGGRSDIFGNVHPAFVNTNFLMGFQRPSDYFMESFSCRKSLIANYYQMSDSGYTLRQADLLTIDVNLDQSIEDCGNKRYIAIDVRDKKILKMIKYKYIVDHFDTNGDPVWRMVRSNETELIGTTVLMRSSLECNAPQGKVCKKCYGEHSRVMDDYHAGIVASHAILHPLEQMVLSTKHLLKTISKNKEFSEEMKEYFICNVDSIKIKPEVLKQHKRVELVLVLEDIDDIINAYNDEISYFEESDDDYMPNILISAIGRFYLNVDGTLHQFHRDEADLYINYNILDKISKMEKFDNENIYINLHEYGSERSIFDLNIENIEVTVYLKKIMSMFGIKSNMKYTDYKQLFNDFLNILHELNLVVQISHVELLIYNLIRDPNNILLRPNFSGKDPVQYTILSLPKAILKSNSITTSLSFERIRSQLDDASTFMKNGRGYMDALYK